MIEGVTISIAPAGEVIALDLWSGEIGDLLPGTRHVQIEPRRWWVFGMVPAEAIGDRCALTPIGGGLMCATFTGPGWRALLTVSGLIDSETPAFTTGSVAASVIHHVPVWILVTAPEICEVYYAASYAATLADLWRGATGGR